MAIWCSSYCMAQGSKSVSILGDSYSTFEGYLQPDTNSVWYYKTPKYNTDVTRVEQTWWHQVIKKNNYRLAVNNSFSGATICNTGYRKEDYTNRSFITRMKNLGKPDIIFIFGATNDNWAGAPLGEYRYEGWTKESLYQFRPATAYMLHHMKKDYPGAEIYFLLNNELKPSINESVKTICKRYNIHCIELKDIDKKSGHPSIKGMTQISDQVNKYLLQNTPTVFSIAKYKDDKTCAISYTFDDGLKEHYTLVTPKLKQLGMKATFWINGSKINNDENTIVDTTRMTWKNLQEMSRKGHEISNHGWAHKNFGRFSIEEIKEDIFKNDSAILANTGIMPRTFCYPNNTKTPEGVKLASENRVGTRLEQRSVGGKSTDENLEKWVEDLLKNREWGITMTHGITYGYDQFSSAGILWQHLEKVKKLEDSIWVGTFKDVVSYAKEREAILLDIERKKNGLTITPHLLLDRALFTVPLTGVINRGRIKSVKIVQGKKQLKSKILPGKVLFEFDPFGGKIDITLNE